jgi:S-adenosylmethionine-diacylglycerol 3-amino-3-carboxypropyl transferase
MPHALARRFFEAIHRHQLVYNTCWEDPRLDRAALSIGRADQMLVITSAGCNALDYALDEPAHIAAVDVNPRQNALLELKQAAIRALDFEEFFALFGRGCLPAWADRYRRLLRPQLSLWARRNWDRKGSYFARGGSRSFYYRGTAGRVARGLNAYLDHVVRARQAIDALLGASTLAEQRDIYDRQLRQRLWRPLLRRLAGHDAMLAMLAVPRPQREHLERAYPLGIAGFIEERIEQVFRDLPIADNYFWRVYLTGAYSATCCPEYLKTGNFARLKAGLVDRISTHTCSVEQFLVAHQSPVSCFVLLDHMDWLCDDGLPALQAEWQAIVRRAAPGARLLWRSGGRETGFIDDLRVEVQNRTLPIGSLLTYSRELAADLHARDRVNTYGSFHVAQLAV